MLARFLLSFGCLAGLGFAGHGFAGHGSLAAAESLVVVPAEVKLDGNFAQVQLLAAKPAGDSAADRSVDLTSRATFASSNPAVVTVSERGRLLAVANGSAVVTVSAGDARQDVPVTVSGVVEKPAIGFVEHVRPIFNKRGCAAAACHASQFGKGGFKLSVFGFDPSADFAITARDEVQRRIDLIEPGRSLLLQKPLALVPHGGGKRLLENSIDHRVLLAWLEANAPAPKANAPEVTRLIVTPARRLAREGERQQLRVEAVYADGVTRDVTHWARFDSMDDVMLGVDDHGLVSVSGKGQAPVMVRFEGQADIAMFAVPYADAAPLAGWEHRNFVDELAARKFRELGIEPSGLCDDATFLRRAFADAIGGLPTVAETEAFLADATPTDRKREQLVDRLLGLTGNSQLDLYNDRYAAVWTQKWSDLIRTNSISLGEQGMWSLHNWIRESFRTNKPFDRFVRELVTAKGSIYMHGPANFFRLHSDSSLLTEATAQTFLGVRLECAKCHQHPFERYRQADYYGLAAFFSRVGTKNSEEFGLFGREQVVVVRATGDVRHPKTGQLMKPTTLDGQTADHDADRRLPLADWLTGPTNGYFARNVANRYVAYLLGRGLVEPIDDLRATNPPSNPELLDALARQFVESKFDLKRLMRTIMTSRLYQLDSQPTPANAADSRFYSHFFVKRVAAEPLLDAVDQVAGSPTKFPNLPLGTRAIELPDAEYPNYFLTTFGKPRRTSVCECERTREPSLAQSLHTLNGRILNDKLADPNGRVAKLVASGRPHAEIVTELYLAALCRRPTEGEMNASIDFLEESPSAKECYEDLLWALMNSKQFLFVQ